MNFKAKIALCQPSRYQCIYWRQNAIKKQIPNHNFYELIVNKNTKGSLKEHTITLNAKVTNKNLSRNFFNESGVALSKKR